MDRVHWGIMLTASFILARIEKVCVIFRFYLYLFSEVLNCNQITCLFSAVGKIQCEIMSMHGFWGCSKGQFTNTCKGGPDAKIFIAKLFRGPPSDRKKKSGPPFLTWKLWVNPVEKHVNSIFNGKSVVIFSGPPLQGSKILRVPLFASGPPYKCFWTVPNWNVFVTQFEKNRASQLPSRYME